MKEQRLERKPLNSEARANKVWGTMHTAHDDGGVTRAGLADLLRPHDSTPEDQGALMALC